MGGGEQNKNIIVKTMGQKICGIYKISSPSGRVYIGQSVDIKRRLKSYRLCRCKEQPILYRSILKYGWESHSFEVIHKCMPEALNALEKQYVDFFNSFNSDNGMNLRDGGGSCGLMSEESKIKMGDSRRGKKHTEETKLRLSEIHKKITKSKEWCNNISKGKKNPSKEVRERIGKSSIGRKAFLGRKHSQEAKDKMRLSKIGNPAHNRRPVIDINTGVVYSCKKEAADCLSLKVRTLKAKLEGKITNNTSIRYYDLHLSHSIISKSQSPLSQINM